VKPKFAVKGAHVAQVKHLVDSLLGARTFERFALQAGATREWESIVISSWYDVFVLNAVLLETSSRTGRSVESIQTEVARNNALSDLTSIYRMFLRVAQPTRMLYFTPQLWRNYVSFGDSRAVRNDTGSYLGETVGFPEALIDWVCGSWLGFIPTGIELAGGSIESAEIVKREMRGSDSAVRCEIRYRAP
jgi:hypothetical protein